MSSPEAEASKYVLSAVESLEQADSSLGLAARVLEQGHIETPSLSRYWDDVTIMAFRLRHIVKEWEGEG